MKRLLGSYKEFSESEGGAQQKKYFVAVVLSDERMLRCFSSNLVSLSFCFQEILKHLAIENYCSRVFQLSTLT